MKFRSKPMIFLNQKFSVIKPWDLETGVGSSDAGEFIKLCWFSILSENINERFNHGNIYHIHRLPRLILSDLKKVLLIIYTT